MFLAAQHWCRGLRLANQPTVSTTKLDKSTKKPYLSATHTQNKLCHFSYTIVKTGKGEQIKLNIQVYSIKVASSHVFKLNFFYSILILKTYIFFYTIKIINYITQQTQISFLYPFMFKRKVQSFFCRVIILYVKQLNLILTRQTF